MTACTRPGSVQIPEDKNPMSQKLDLFLAKNRLQRVDSQTVFMKTAKHLMKMLSVGGMVRARNLNVVEVDKNERQTSQDAVSWSCHCANQTACGRTQKRLKGMMMAVFGMLSGNLVVPLDEVKGREHAGAGHVIRKQRTCQVLVPWCITSLNNAGLLHIFKLCLCSGVFLRVQMARRRGDGPAPRKHHGKIS